MTVMCTSSFQNHCSHSHLIHMLLPQEYCDQLIHNNRTDLHDFALTTHCDLVLEPTPLPFTDEHVIEICGSEIHLIDTVAQLLLSSRHYHVRQPYYPTVTDNSIVMEVSSDSSMDLGTNYYHSGDVLSSTSSDEGLLKELSWLDDLDG